MEIKETTTAAEIAKNFAQQQFRPELEKAIKVYAKWREKQTRHKAADIAPEYQGEMINIRTEFI